MGPSQGVRAVVGKKAVFALAAGILGELKQMPRSWLSKYETRILKEASAAIHDADAWRKFCANRGPCVDSDSKEAYELFSRATGALGRGGAWIAYWEEVRNAGCTLQVLTQGGTIGLQQLVAAETLCTMVSGTSVAGVRVPFSR